jgi:peptidoglycan/xylan/chitin deacetylase (PgdA/CDA1 family)
VTVQEKKILEDIIGKKIVGYRNQYLKFKIPDTWEMLSEAGFKYDTTFGYADCAGFRNGMCHPFKPFNLNTGKEIDILEIPLVIMDCTLLRDYMRLDFERAWKLTKLLINRVEQYNGVITILWHNNFYDRVNI